jgi:protein TonB
MSNIDLASKEWCDLVFEGRYKNYGAYALRAKASARRFYSIVSVLVGIIVLVVLVLIKSAVSSVIEANRDITVEMETSLSELKKEEPKKEEKKVEIKQEYKPKEIQKVAVKASIAFTVPDIVDQVDETKALKTQDEVTRQNIAIASQDYIGDSEDGINIDDLKDNQMAGGDEVPEEEEIHENVEQKAEFPGGEAALLKYIRDNVKYPAIALEQDLQGIVLLRFVVERDGSVGDVQVQKSLSAECDREAIRVVKAFPRFIPAKINGRPVRNWFRVPVRFIIQ